MDSRPQPVLGGANLQPPSAHGRLRSQLRTRCCSSTQHAHRMCGLAVSSWRRYWDSKRSTAPLKSTASRRLQPSSAGGRASSLHGR